MPEFLNQPMAAFYAIILVVIIGSFIFGDFRNKLVRSIQQLSLWAVIIAAVTVAFGYRGDIESRFFPNAAVQVEGEAIVLQRSRDGHFYATLGLNGTNIPFIVDTGASQIVITKQDAEKAGLDPESLNYFGRAQTANGVVKTARVRIDEITLGNRTDKGVLASVNGADMETSLLGMTYLSRFQKIEIAGNELRLLP